MRIVAGKFRGKAITSPKGAKIRPTSDRVRESMFNILSSRLGPAFEGVRVLDLFAGTGALGLEALSRGASRAIFVDTGIEARGLIRDHIQSFGVAGQAKLLKRNATSLGSVEGFKPFSLIFLDPPYNQGLGDKALISLRDGGWLVGGATLVLEERASVPIDLPDNFAVDDTRKYGDTNVHFLSYEALQG